MRQGEPWLKWASELQSLAQAGLYYGRDKFDLERYARIREIAAEMVAHQADLPLEQVKGWFCNETSTSTQPPGRAQPLGSFTSRIRSP